jgi:GTP-binding protein
VHGKTRIKFLAPSRGLIGYRSEFLTDTRGTGIDEPHLPHYGPYKGDIEGRRNGALISTDLGEAVAYAIFNLQDRGFMFIGHQRKGLSGHGRGRTQPRQRPRHQRAEGQEADERPRIGRGRSRHPRAPAAKMTLEEMMAYINDDELVEVTPKSLRLRKRFLSPNERELAKKQSKKSAEG